MSAIYQGWIRHRRYQPKPHTFRYGIFYAYLDLDELPDLLANTPFFGTSPLSPVRFKRSDYLGPSDVPLKQAVHDLVYEKQGLRLQGKVCMLTHLRYFGHCFNPVTFYYCFEDGAEDAVAIVAEINNTPWDQRYAYVMTRHTAKDHRYRFPKDFHVSPFMPMAQNYDWQFESPKQHLRVHMRNLEADHLVFDATLMLDRLAWSGKQLCAAVMRHPLVTVKAIFAIYYQAFRLWMKRNPFHDHPDSSNHVSEVKHAPIKS